MKISNYFLFFGVIVLSLIFAYGQKTEIVSSYQGETVDCILLVKRNYYEVWNNSPSSDVHVAIHGENLDGGKTMRTVSISPSSKELIKVSEIPSTVSSEITEHRFVKKGILSLGNFITVLFIIIPVMLNLATKIGNQVQLFLIEEKESVQAICDLVVKEVNLSDSNQRDMKNDILRKFDILHKKSTLSLGTIIANRYICRLITILLNSDGKFRTLETSVNKLNAILPRSSVTLHLFTNLNLIDEFRKKYSPPS